MPRPAAGDLRTQWKQIGDALQILKSEAKHQDFVKASLEQLLFGPASMLHSGLGLLVSAICPEDVLEKVVSDYWEIVEGRRFRERLDQYAGMQGWLGASDQVDVERLHRRIRGYFAAGVAAYMALCYKSSTDAEHWNKMVDWLARAAGIHDHPRDTPPHLPNDPKKYLQAARDLLRRSNNRDQVVQAYYDQAYYDALFWLNDPITDSQKRYSVIPFLTADPTYQKKRAMRHSIRVELLPEEGRGLIEAACMWNWPLGKAFADTVSEAYLRTSPAQRCKARWEFGAVEVARLTPLHGDSHGLSVHVGFRLLVEKEKQYDERWLFSGKVVESA